MSSRYSEAGVSLEAGYESVNLIKKHVARTARAGMVSGIGSFGGLFDPWFTVPGRRVFLPSQPANKIFRLQLVGSI